MSKTAQFTKVLDEVALKSKIFHENIGLFATIMHPGLMFVLMVISFIGLFVTDSYSVAIFATVVGASAFVLQVVGSVRHIRGI